ncbi:hypothetical protein EXS89_07505 [Helicobacter pylori]|nr:hypothetical protein [Helicobacter pylori]
MALKSGLLGFRGILKGDFRGVGENNFKILPIPLR